MRSTLPYSILWADSTTELQRNLLGGGKYNYNMVDANGCEISGMVILTEPQRDDWSRAGNAGIDPLTQFIGTTDSSDLAFRSNNQEVMRIAGNGKIGIGITNPQFTLDVEGIVRMNDQILMPALSTVPEPDSSNAQMEYKSLFTDNDGKVFKGFPEFLIGILDSMTTGECLERYDGTNVTTWKSLPAPAEGAKRIIYAGSSPACAPYVGIGTMNPLTDFHVAGSAYTEYSTQIGGIFDPNNTKALLVNGASEFIGSTYTPNAAQIGGIYDPNNTRALLVDGPSDFKSFNERALFVHHTSNTDYSIANEFTVDNATTKVISSGAPNNPPFIVYGDGTTLIGTSSNNPVTPEKQTKLAVYGLISTHEVRVQLDNFPDYVFEDDYCIDNLEDVAGYIKENKHLPGVIPAKDVQEKGGFELGAVQLMTLEKLEELYLHVIQLNERIKLLEKENELPNTK